MPTYRDDAGECPSCGEVQDSATDLVGDGPPAEGDLTICATCGAISVFTGVGLDRRPATGPERFRALRAVLRDVHR